MRLVLIGMLFLLSVEAGSAEIKTFEEWRFNPRERTAKGLSALEQEDLQSAVESLDTAARIDSSNPLALFNAGTARLLAGREDAIDPLEAAATTATGELLPAIHYNVGNAHLAGGNPAAAIEAFKETLRANPEHTDAKHNLELARRLLEQQQRQQQQQQQKQQDQQPQEDQGNEGSSPEQPPEPEQQSPGEPDPEEDSRQDQGQDQDQQQSDTEHQAEGEDPRAPSRDLLPGFDEQEDMTAEQAAAILDAVENLERQQRRQQATERARQRARAGKDW